jgi:CO/xanthine dehydrogenase Mo-binding subunit
MPNLPGALQRNAALDLWIRIEPQATTHCRRRTRRRSGAHHRRDRSDRQSPNEFITAGSVSVEDSGSAIRQACAQARRIMLERACAELGAAADTIEVVDGVMGVPGANRTLSFWDVQGGRPFGIGLKTMGCRKTARALSPVSPHRHTGQGAR